MGNRNQLGCNPFSTARVWMAGGGVGGRWRQVPDRPYPSPVGRGRQRAQVWRWSISQRVQATRVTHVRAAPAVLVEGSLVLDAAAQGLVMARAAGVRWATALPATSSDMAAVVQARTAAALARRRGTRP